MKDRLEQEPVQPLAEPGLEWGGFVLGDEATSKLKQYLDLNGGQCRARTCDLLLVRQAL